MQQKNDDSKNGKLNNLPADVMHYLTQFMPKDDFCKFRLLSQNFNRLLQEEAIQKLSENPDIRIMIEDYPRGWLQNKFRFRREVTLFDKLLSPFIIFAMFFCLSLLFIASKHLYDTNFKKPEWTIKFILELIGAILTLTKAQFEFTKTHNPVRFIKEIYLPNALYNFSQETTNSLLEISCSSPPPPTP